MKRVITFNFKMSRALRDAVEQRAIKLGESSSSAYVRKLILADLREDDPAMYERLVAEMSKELSGT